MTDVRDRLNTNTPYDIFPTVDINIIKNLETLMNHIDKCSEKGKFEMLNAEKIQDTFKNLMSYFGKLNILNNMLYNVKEYYMPEIIKILSELLEEDATDSLWDTCSSILFLTINSLKGYNAFIDYHNNISSHLYFVDIYN